MRSPLDNLERHLQTIIEASARLFGRDNRQEKLARNLVSALYDELPAQLYGHNTVPDHVTIYLHPDNVAAWQQPQWMDWITRVVEDALVSAGFTFATRPAVQLAPAADLAIDSLRVTTVRSSDALGSTAAMPVTGELHPPATSTDDLPVNAYLIVQGSRTVPLTQRVFNIGRRPDNDLVLEDARISRTHLQIRAIRGRFILFDLNSTGGTLVNGNPVSEHQLAPGDVILIGGVSLIYSEDSPGWMDHSGNSTSPVGM